MKQRPHQQSHDASRLNEHENYDCESTNLPLGVEEGIVKRQYHEPSHDASHTDESENYATITFKDSPFYGQKGRILKRTTGGHPELHLEMPNGARIKVDVLWTDDRRLGLTRRTHVGTNRIDLEEAESIIEFLEYLNRKLIEDLNRYSQASR